MTEELQKKLLDEIRRLNKLKENRPECTIDRKLQGITETFKSDDDLIDALVKAIRPNYDLTELNIRLKLRQQIRKELGLK